MNHVFLSHASDDKPFVEELGRALEGQGIPVWLDKKNLRGGQRLHLLYVADRWNDYGA